MPATLHKMVNFYHIQRKIILRGANKKILDNFDVSFHDRDVAGMNGLLLPFKIRILNKPFTSPSSYGYGFHYYADLFEIEDTFRATCVDAFGEEIAVSDLVTFIVNDRTNGTKTTRLRRGKIEKLFNNPGREGSATVRDDNGQQHRVLFYKLELHRK